jgi:hypothetical protein
MDQRPQSSSKQLVAVELAALPVAIFGLAIPDWCGRLFKSESVGGRAHESQCIRFVWSGGLAAYRNGGADAFSRYSARERHWHLKVL